MQDFESFKDKIIRDYPRLSLEDNFKFACHPGVACFGKCCADVNIFLTPYDVLRMKNALGISSAEFLKKYTVPLSMEENQLPVVLLKMEETEEKKCPFVAAEGCTIYEDRPWSCRMYPIGLASSKTQSGEGEEFCFIVDQDEGFCQGFGEDRECTIKGWMDDQDVGTFNQKSESYMQFTLHPYLQAKKDLSESKLQMFFTSCYDIDGFRKMIFESSFLNRFVVGDDVVAKLQSDDEALLEFAVTKWLPFALFREDTMVVMDEELEKGAKKIGWKVE